ncbi:hypothetical protein FRC06_008413 [Ceratobasidium sp. 370]|nr:hypothetical protein FRC06_008413 [Ceratobasidium sp. 370]
MQAPPPPPNELLQRIASLQNEPPHYEASWYGPLNALLQYYFRLAQRWMIKPQAVIRDAAPIPSPATSIDSYDRAVDDQPDYPDFIVCNYSANGRDDRIKLIIEVKAGNRRADVRRGRRQMLRYLQEMDSGLGPGHVVGLLYGVLICRTTAYFYRRIQAGMVQPWAVGGQASMAITSANFREFLHSCSVGIL